MRAPQMTARGDVTINMTPMIDVVFLLIIFFLVSSHIGKQEANMKLDLPKAATGLTTPTDRSHTTVNIATDGTWQVGGHWITAERLKELLSERYQREKGLLQVRIRVDRDVPYQRVSPLLKICSEVGIGDVVFAVNEPPPVVSRS